MKITSDSHTDHRLTPAHLAWLLELFGDRSEFFIAQVEIPDRLSEVECGLHGPKVGDAPVPEDEVVYIVRGPRSGASRMCLREPRPTRVVTVIAGPHEDEPCILYTAFGGPAAPREPFDPSIADDTKAKQESETFWSEHALSMRGA